MATKRKKPSIEKPLLRTAIYIRVSTDRQAREGDSMRDQLASGQKYIDSHENMILAGTYVDDGISGQKINRDDFQRLMDDIKDGKIDLIIFTRLDRWFRNLRHYLNTQDILDKYGVSWTAIDQPYLDTSTPHGRAFVNNSMIWAELEAQNDSERILNVFEDKVKNGEVLSGKTPLGYSIVDKHLQPNEDAPKVVEIFEYYRKTGNLTQTSFFMEREYGLVRDCLSLKNMLRNTKYIGEFRDNKQYCPAIIDRESFEDVQRFLKMNIKVGKTHDYIFSGLVVCQNCGHKMASGQAFSKYTGSGGIERIYRYSTYRCRYGISHRRCGNRKTIMEHRLEKMLLSYIRPGIEKHIAECEVENKSSTRTDAKRRSIEGKLQRLKDLYLNDIITMDEYKLDRGRFMEQLESLEAEEPKPARDLSFLKNLLKIDFEDRYKDYTISEKREFWRSLVREIRIDHEKNIEIIFM